MRCQWIWSNFGKPVYWSSGLCSCVAGEFVWYVLLWNLLALGWCLVSVYGWRHLMSSCWLMFPGSGVLWCSQDLDLSLLLLVFSLIFTVVSRLLHLLLKTLGCFSQCLMSSAGIQKLFCGIYSAFKCSFDEFVGEKVLSHPIPLPS